VKPLVEGPPGGRAVPTDLETFIVTISYGENRGHGLERVTKQVTAHPVRTETHHYFWIFRDC
jgi:hypothetical protein